MKYTNAQSSHFQQVVKLSISSLFLYDFMASASKVSDEILLLFHVWDMETIFEKYKSVSQEASQKYKLHIQNLENRVCPDMDFGDIRFIEKNLPAAILSREKHIHRLILILESPHVKEYSNQNNILPAQGTTGRNIKKWLFEIVAKGLQLCSNKNQIWNLIVVNAIQYQCSQGLVLYKKPNHVKAKNFVFSTLMSSDIYKKNLCDRLLTYFAPGDILLNCCTKGAVFVNKSSDKISNNKSLVQEVIKDCNLVKNCFHGFYHPSAWKKNLIEDMEGDFLKFISSFLLNKR